MNHSVPPPASESPDAPPDKTPVEALDPVVIRYLEPAHRELLQVLLAAPARDRATIDVKALPLQSQRFVWKLYATHYPDVAQWIRGLDMDLARELLDAKLELRAIDIINAVSRSARR